MPTRSINLTPEQDAFIGEALKAGEYRDASEVVTDAILALQQKRAKDELALLRLKEHIQVGVAALEDGDYTEIADANLDDYLDRITEPPTR